MIENLTRQEKLERMCKALEPPPKFGDLIGGFIPILMGVSLLGMGIQIATQSLKEAGVIE